MDRYEGTDYQRARVHLKRVTDNAIIEAEIYLGRVQTPEKEADLEGS